MEKTRIVMGDGGGRRVCDLEFGAEFDRLPEVLQTLVRAYVKAHLLTVLDLIKRAEAASAYMEEWEASRVKGCCLVTHCKPNPGDRHHDLWVKEPFRALIDTEGCKVTVLEYHIGFDTAFKAAVQAAEERMSRAAEAKINLQSMQQNMEAEADVTSKDTRDAYSAFGLAGLLR